ncbi:hypothetical protein AX17_006091 [Amanita inopinata Kibby_2008]|nr:hypothetical protein AX17_006091 [Amanita inopinata Kibby_2008]
MIDVRHIPYGCSVWPSFFTFGIEKEWPHGGEIDIIEAINDLGNNQMALHADRGCTQYNPPGQTGRTLEMNCTTNRGCIVAETKQNSFGESFAQAGGGVWATQIDVSGIYIWFWSRPDIPNFIATATSTSTMDPSMWGPPSASYPALGCNYTQFFTPQQLVLVTTLCGGWAGEPSNYMSTCHTATGSCVADNIIGPGSPTYDNAYWDVAYIRTYIAQNSQPGAPPLDPTTSNASNPPAATSPATGSSVNPKNSAVRADVDRVSVLLWTFFLGVGVFFSGSF